uniref:Uncharacterized protein n=1 Tax=Cacopsylla melanoneura TaxID=428564 RepID=A0A8D8YYJ6_9HEMI
MVNSSHSTSTSNSSSSNSDLPFNQSQYMGQSHLQSAGQSQLQSVGQLQSARVKFIADLTDQYEQRRAWNDKLLHRLGGLRVSSVCDEKLDAIAAKTVECRFGKTMFAE